MNMIKVRQDEYATYYSKVFATKDDAASVANCDLDEMPSWASKALHGVTGWIVLDGWNNPAVNHMVVK